MSQQKIDPVMVDIISNALNSFVREMRVTISSTAFSPIIWQVHDFSCGLLAANGDLAALSQDNPAHIVPTPFSVQAVLGRFQDDIAPGDIFVTNDCYRLGTHLNDVAHLLPIFIEGRLAFWIVARIHYTDIGGSFGGSIVPDATEVYQEGIFIPPTRVYNRGQRDEGFFDLFFSNVRGAEERRGDFMAVMGSFWTGTKRFQEIINKYGAAAVLQCQEVLRKRAKARMEDAILELPEGEYTYELNLDSDGVEPGWVPLRVSLRIQHKPSPKITLDFSESAPTVRGPMNGAHTTAVCAAFTTIKAFLDPHFPVNSGAFEPIEVITKEGTIFEARRPSPMCGSLDLGYRTLELVMGALAPARPEQAAADHSSAAHVYFSGWDPYRNNKYVFYDMPIGGTGAVCIHDGNSTLAGFERGDFGRISSVEINEYNFPYLAIDNELLTDSGGAGKWRGGLGMRRSWKLLGPSAIYSDLAEPCLTPFYGLFGGLGGMPSTSKVLRSNRVLWPGGVTGTGKATRFPLIEGDVVQLDRWGGGGYGDPLERDPELVLQDLQNGFISEESAKNLYGVVIHNGQVDTAATGKLRREMQEELVLAFASPQPIDTIKEQTRLWEVGKELAERLKVKDGDVVEGFTSTTAPLRGRVKVNSRVSGYELPIGPFAIKVLRVQPGDRIRIRKVSGALIPPKRE